MIKLNVRICSDKECVLDYDITVDSKTKFIDNISKCIKENTPIVVNGNNIANIFNPSRMMAIQIEEIKDV